MSNVAGEEEDVTDFSTYFFFRGKSTKAAKRDRKLIFTLFPPKAWDTRARHEIPRVLHIV